MSSLRKKKIVTRENVKKSEEVGKGTNILDDMKEAVVKIRRNNLDNFEGQSKGSTGWFNLDHEFLKRKFLHLNRTSIKNFLNNTFKVKILNHIKSLWYHLILIS